MKQNKSVLVEGSAQLSGERAAGVNNSTLDEDPKPMGALHTGSKSEDVIKEIKPKQRTKKPNNNSLLDLFQSELFTTHMLFRYLFKRPEEGVISYLVNKLFTEPTKELDYYLP